ncbi:hypothetical protein MVEG_08484 [Podila verticillata NRRL 6337]|nr:hypothetical protein MVEG_08484 [Podila verticillata NRRL 6337]
MADRPFNQRSAICEPNLRNESTISRAYINATSARSFLRALPIVSSIPRHSLSQNNITRQIASFLQLESFDNELGGLQRTIYDALGTPVRWLCSAHSFEYASTRALDVFVQLHEGEIDRQLGTIQIQLSSVSQVGTFVAALKDAKHIFDISIGLAWILRTGELQVILTLLADSRIAVLEMDGITLAEHFQSHTGSQSDMFVQAIGSSTLQHVTLLNYPQSSERYKYSGHADASVHGLWIELSPKRPDVGWLGLRDIVDKYLDKSTRSISAKLSESDGRLDPYIISNLKEIDIFDLKRKTWKGRLGVKNNVLIGYVEAVAPNPPSNAHSVLMHGALDRLVFRSQCIAIPEDESVLDLSLVHHNPKLRHLDISTQEGQIFQQLELLHKTWRGDDQLLVEVSENARQTDDRKIATVIIRNKVPKARASAIVYLDSTGVPPCARRRPAVVDVLYWNRDYVTGALKDKDAAILDIASQLFPSILTKLRLDTSRLTGEGLASVQEVLRRSTLEHLHIQCVPYSAW